MNETLIARFSCPQCGAANEVGQVQGDRCPGCGFEFKWFAPGEERTADDFFRVLTGVKHRVVLAPGQGSIIAHE